MLLENQNLFFCWKYMKCMLEYISDKTISIIFIKSTL